MAIGDVHSEDRGSGARLNDGKVPLDLIPLSAMIECARVFDYGRNKYAAWNWAKGMDWSVPYGCLLRHMAAWFDGEDNDPESGLPHLGHAMCNLVMLSTFARTYREGDDRPARWLGASVEEVAFRVVAEKLALDDGEPNATGGGMATHHVEPAPELSPGQAAFADRAEPAEDVIDALNFDKPDGAP